MPNLRVSCSLGCEFQHLRNKTQKFLWQGKEESGSEGAATAKPLQKQQKIWARNWSRKDGYYKLLQVAHPSLKLLLTMDESKQGRNTYFLLLVNLESFHIHQFVVLPFCFLSHQSSQILLTFLLPQRERQRNRDRKMVPISLQWTQ
jgi:hypothetical protein